MDVTLRGSLSLPSIDTLDSECDDDKLSDLHSINTERSNKPPEITKSMTEAPYHSSQGREKTMSMIFREGNPKPLRRSNTDKSRSRSQMNTNRSERNQPPQFMGDILDDIFGGSIRTPGVKAVDDQLSMRITPLMAFEELRKIRASPIIFLAFYTDAENHRVLESLHFILEVEEFRVLPVQFSMEREKEIIDTYLRVGSVREINIPETDRKNILLNRENRCQEIFTEVQKYVTHMLIRNVDNTWKYKQIPVPIKPMKTADVKKVIDKVTSDRRVQDLLFYFLCRRITPLMYQMRASSLSLHHKVKTRVPIGYVHLNIKELSLLRITTRMTVYINGKSFYQTRGTTIIEKGTKTRTKPKFGQKIFRWNEKLIFNVKDIPTQAIDLHIWEKKITPNSLIGSFTISLQELIKNAFEETEEDLVVNINQSGQLLLTFHYLPNETEIKRLKIEQEAKEQAARAVSQDFDFLLS